MKKELYIICILQIALYATLPAQEQLYSFKESARYGLKNASGKVLISPKYEQLGWSNETKITNQSVVGYYDKGWGLVSTKGKVITQPLYSSLEMINGNQLIASKKTPVSDVRLFGLIDSKGKIVLEFAYHSLSSFSLNLYVFENSNYKNGLIDTKGKIIIEASIDNIRPFSKGKYLVYKSGKVGLIDSLGAFILPPKYKKISNDMATEPFPQIEIRTKENSLTQSIEADSVIIFNNKSIAVFRNNHLEVFNPKMQTIAQRENIIKIKESGNHVVLYHSHGAQIISTSALEVSSPQSYDDVRVGEPKAENNRLIAVKKGSRWGYITTSGDETISYQFEEAWPFVGKIAHVVSNGKQHLINESGRRIGSIDYDSVAIQTNNTAIGTVKKRSQLIDSSGSILFDIYGDIKPHSLGYLTKNENGLLGLISEYGEVIFNPVHEKISEVINNKYMVVKTPSRLGLTLLDGTWSYWLTGDYQDMEAVTDEFIGIKRNEQWGYINYRKQLIIANRYDSIRCFHKGMAAVNLNSHWGFIDKREEIVVQPNFEEIGIYQDGLAIAKKNGLYGIIDEQGKQITYPMKYDQVIRLNDKKFMVLKERKYGLVDSNGKQLTPISFSKISPVDDGNFLVARRGLNGLISPFGRYLIPLKYAEIKVSKSGYYLCRISSKQ